MKNILNLFFLGQEKGKLREFSGGQGNLEMTSKVWEKARGFEN